MADSKADAQRYAARGVSADKEDVHNAIKVSIWALLVPLGQRLFFAAPAWPRRRGVRDSTPRGASEMHA